MIWQQHDDWAARAEINMPRPECAPARCTVDKCTHTECPFGQCTRAWYEVEQCVWCILIQCLWNTTMIVADNIILSLFCNTQNYYINISIKLQCNWREFWWLHQEKASPRSERSRHDTNPTAAVAAVTVRKSRATMLNNSRGTYEYEYMYAQPPTDRVSLWTAPARVRPSVYEY